MTTSRRLDGPVTESLDGSPSYLGTRPQSAMSKRYSRPWRMPAGAEPGEFSLQGVTSKAGTKVWCEGLGPCGAESGPCSPANERAVGRKPERRNFRCDESSFGNHQVDIPWCPMRHNSTVRGIFSKGVAPDDSRPDRSSRSLDLVFFFDGSGVAGAEVSGTVGQDPRYGG